jgi:NTP pyrophosphatase (non-canonical NTP hydrolase)
MDIFKIQNQLQKFASERDWEQFHSPKNLSMALSVEASELVEIFQWLTLEESNFPDQKQLDSIQSEVADIAMYLIRFCDVLKINLEEAIEEKFIENGNKYPIELSKGSSKKYNHRDN